MRVAPCHEGRRHPGAAVLLSRRSPAVAFAFEPSLRGGASTELGFWPLDHGVWQDRCIGTGGSRGGDLMQSTPGFRVTTLRDAHPVVSSGHG